MSEDLTIKCDEITNLAKGGYRQSDLELIAVNVDVEHIIDQLNTAEVLSHIGCVEIVEFLESEGYTVNNC